MFTDDNNIYIGGTNVLLDWGNVPDDVSGLTDENITKIRSSVVERVQKLFRDYLELDNVSFLFGTGSSIHLGAASIQNIPHSVKKEINENHDTDIVDDFKKYVQKLQSKKNVSMERGDIVTDANGWTYAFDGDYYCNCDVKEEEVNGKKQKVVGEYGEIDVPLETLLNYLIANLYVAEAEQDDNKVKRLQKLIAAIKKAMFNLCDVHLRPTKDSDLKRIKSKGYEDIFKKDKYIFHEKFLKSLLQRPLNLKRANIL